MDKKFSHKSIILYKYRILWHILFWIVIYGGFVLSYGGYVNNNYYDESRINLVLMPTRIIFTYIMLYWLLPKKLLQGKINSFVILSLMHCLLYGWVIWINMRAYYIYVECTCLDPEKYGLFYLPKILVNMIPNYVIVLLASMYKLFKYWHDDQLYKVQIEKEKLESELKYLKAQIHPHFLFNTLNNLYALTLENSKEASGVVIKLSGLLDYMIYHSKENRVPLQKELDIISNYIELEEIRYGNRLDLTFKIEGNTESIQIAPLILMPFVENAFKHGASIDRGNSTVYIHLKVDGDCIVFIVENSVPKSVTKEGKKEGIGLKNIRRQLDLLYADSHELIIEPSGNRYKITLKLNCMK